MDNEKVGICLTPFKDGGGKPQNKNRSKRIVYGYWDTRCGAPGVPGLGG